MANKSDIGIDALIRYHRDGLQQYRQHMGPSAQVLEERTIECLEELKVLQEKIARADIDIPDQVFDNPSAKACGFTKRSFIEAGWRNIK